MKRKDKEQLLKDAGFKRKWLDDKSGYWFERKVGKYLKYYADPSPSFNSYYVEVVGPEGWVVLKEYRGIKSLIKCASRGKFVL